jgi:hypothetical protein
MTEFTPHILQLDSLTTQKGQNFKLALLSPAGGNIIQPPDGPLFYHLKDL